jgi:hypothetical protein
MMENHTMTTKQKHLASGIMLARHLDQGVSLQDAVDLTRLELREHGCDLDDHAYDRLLAVIKAAACEEIEGAEICKDRESAA